MLTVSRKPWCATCYIIRAVFCSPHC